MRQRVKQFGPPCGYISASGEMGPLNPRVISRLANALAVSPPHMGSCGEVHQSPFGDVPPMPRRRARFSRDGLQLVCRGVRTRDSGPLRNTATARPNWSALNENDRSIAWPATELGGIKFDGSAKKVARARATPPSPGCSAASTYGQVWSAGATSLTGSSAAPLSRRLGPLGAQAITGGKCAPPTTPVRHNRPPPAAYPLSGNRCRAEIACRRRAETGARRQVRRAVRGVIIRQRLRKQERTEEAYMLGEVPYRRHGIWAIGECAR